MTLLHAFLCWARVHDFHRRAGFAALEICGWCGHGRLGNAA